jgi:hypothetical protein
MLSLAFFVFASPSAALISFPGGPRSICGLGDVDKDGCADIAVGVGRSDAAGFDAGAIYIVSGKTGKELARRRASSACQGFGTCLASFRDFDQDGVRDFAVGAPHWTGYEFRNDTCTKPEPGAVLICSGKDASVLATWSGEHAGDRFGYSIASAGDVDHDSIEDLVVGAPGSGDAYVLSGKDGRRLLSVSTKAKDALFGEAVAGVSDWNGDGHDDIAVGGPNDGPSGRVHVYSGKDGATILTIEAGDLADPEDDKNHRDYRTRFGCSLAFARDLEGPGKSCLLIGADHSGDETGRVCVYSLSRRACASVLRGTEFAFSRFGSSLDVLGDVDGDGVPELVIANPDDDLGGPTTEHGQAPGSVVVLSGKTGKTLRTVTGDKHLDRLGYAVAACGDLNADGAPDFVAEAHVAWGETPYFRAYSGKDGALLFQFDAPESKSAAVAPEKQR